MRPIEDIEAENEHYYGLILKAHDAIDILLAMLIERDPKILPTKLKLWATTVALFDAIEKRRATNATE